MASVGYGAYNYGVAAYGTPQYQVASATIAQTSDFDAVAGLTLVASATSAQPLDLHHQPYWLNQGQRQ
jgi:hypothetical protein